MAFLPAHDTDPSVAAFRQEVRDWLAATWLGPRRDAHEHLPFNHHGWDAEFSRLLGQRGWLGLAWPKDHGGAAKRPAELLAFIEEMQFAGAPLAYHNTAETIVGPAIIKHGTPDQKAEFLSAFLRGERSFALHYSEPEAGSDLASLRTTARPDGEGWIVTGQKLWSTGGDKAEWAWLAVRTDPNATPKHAGISVFLVKLDSPGITIRPSMALYGKTFSATFYDDVRIPARQMVGHVNDGWRVITDALANERVMIGTLVAQLQRVFDRITEHIKKTEVLRDNGAIRDRIGMLAAEIEVARQFVLRNARLIEQGHAPIAEAAMSKVFAGELQEKLSETALDLLGAGGLLSTASPSAPIGELEQVLRHSIMGVIGGGTSEMQRNAIALRGLHLPRDRGAKPQ
jgi:alkylation response protein AidB-like acyl-CoA dehydrogenase